MDLALLAGFVGLLVLLEAGCGNRHESSAGEPPGKSAISKHQGRPGVGKAPLCAPDAPLAWLSDSQLLAVRRDLTTQGGQLVRVGVPSGIVQVLWHTPLKIDGWPLDGVSPDGKLVTAHPDAYLLSLVSVATGRVVRHFADSVADFSWAPDSRRLVVDEGTDGSPLRILNLNGHARMISTHLDREPSWSPDGRWIVFTRGRTMDAVRNMELRSGLYLVPAAGGRPQLLAANTSGKAVWAPDSRRFALLGSKVSIYRLDVSGRLVGKPQIVSLGSPYPSPLGWSRDGRLLIVRPGTRLAATLSRKPFVAPAALALFSPSGRWLAVEALGARLWVIDRASGRAAALESC